MEIPVRIGASVECSDGPGGRCVNAVVDPVAERLTHVVVREHWFPHSERLVPIDQVAEATPEVIRLRCTRRELKAMDPFVEIEYIRTTMPVYVAELSHSSVYAFPYVVASGETLGYLEEHEHVPPGELAVRRGARVEATDGDIGRVDEFLVDPKNGHITHLVLREGHLWGQKDVTIPVSQIARLEEGKVHLKLDKRGVEGLPVIPVHRPFWA